jgi:hypothetical protein
MKLLFSVTIRNVTVKFRYNFKEMFNTYILIKTHGKYHEHA